MTPEKIALIARLTVLPSSYLFASRATTGQLVPQDPNDEPASTLLARLRSRGLPATPKKLKKDRA